MASLVVNCWVQPVIDGVYRYPAHERHEVSSPATLLLPAGTEMVCITTDLDTQMTFDGSAVTVADTPIYSGVENWKPVANPAQRLLLTFA